MEFLTEEEIDLLIDIERMLDEAYKHYFELSDGYCKSSEGLISIDFGNYFQRSNQERVRRVEIYSYVFGPGRTHDFNSIEEAHAAVTEWHAAEMVNTHPDPWADVCGAQDWAYDDDNEPFIYGTCQLNKGHEGKWHQEYRDGKLWAEWSGSSDERAPEGARNGVLK